MMYLMSKKFFKDHAEQLVAPRDYIIIDGENAGVSYGDMDDGLWKKYSQCTVQGGWSPDAELYRMLKKLKDGDEVNEKRYARELHDWLHSKDFAASVCVSAMAQLIPEKYSDLNVFVVLPNLVYKHLKNEILERAKKIILKGAPTEVEFIWRQSDLKKGGKKRLQVALKKKELKAIAQGIKAAEKKFKLKKDGD